MGVKSKPVKKTTKPVKAKNQKGGRVHMPAEYYGVESGVYTPNPVAGYSQGDVPVSHGVTHGDVAGPSLSVTPLYLKGGCGCGLKPVLGGGKNKSKRGGGQCGSHNTTQKPMSGGRNKTKKTMRGGKNKKKTKRSRK